MNAVTSFLVGLAITTSAVLVALLYLRNPLQDILTDLCGTAHRARFWATFSNVILFLVPVVFALNQRPDFDARQATVFVIGGQIESAMIGFVLSVVIMGFVLSRYIPRANLPRAGEAKDAR